MPLAICRRISPMLPARRASLDRLVDVIELRLQLAFGLRRGLQRVVADRQRADVRQAPARRHRPAGQQATTSRPTGRRDQESTHRSSSPKSQAQALLIPTRTQSARRSARCPRRPQCTAFPGTCSHRRRQRPGRRIEFPHRRAGRLVVGAELRGLDLGLAERPPADRQLRPPPRLPAPIATNSSLLVTIAALRIGAPSAGSFRSFNSGCLRGPRRSAPPTSCRPCSNRSR